MKEPLQITTIPPFSPLDWTVQNKDYLMYFPEVDFRDGTDVTLGDALYRPIKGETFNLIDACTSLTTPRVIKDSEFGDTGLKCAIDTPTNLVVDPGDFICMGVYTSFTESFSVGIFQDSTDFWTSGGEPIEYIGAFGVDPRNHIAITASNDGSLVAISSNEPTVKIWDTTTRELLQTISTGVSSNSIHFSPDSTKLAVAYDDGTAIVYNAADASTFISFTPVAATNILSIQYSPDGSKIVTGCGDKVEFWDATTGEIIKTFTGGNLAKAKWTPDGLKVVACCQTSAITVWTYTTGAVVTTYNSAGWVGTFAISADSLYVASCDNSYTTGEIKIWNISTGAVVDTLASIGIFGSYLEYSADGSKLIVASRETISSIRIFDTATNTLIETLTGTGSDYGVVTAMSVDGTKLFTGGGLPKVYNLSNLDGESITINNTSDGNLITVNGDSSKSCIPSASYFIGIMVDQSEEDTVPTFKCVYIPTESYEDIVLMSKYTWVKDCILILCCVTLDGSGQIDSITYTHNDWDRTDYLYPPEPDNNYVNGGVWRNGGWYSGWE